MPVDLLRDAKRYLRSNQPSMLLAKRDLNIIPFDLVDKRFQNFNSISNVFQELHEFLILTNYIYLRNSQPPFFLVKNTDRGFPDQENINPQNH